MEEKEKKAQEMYMEFQMLEQHIKKLQAQLEAVTGQLMELNSTSNGLDEFEKIKGEREIFVPVSSGIFAKAKLTETTELLVNVGSNVVVKRDVSSAKKLIHGQMNEIKKIQERIADQLDKLTSRAGELQEGLQELVSRE